MEPSAARIRLPSIVICFFAVVGLSGCRLLSSAKTTTDISPMIERRISVGGLERSYLLYIPEKIRNASAAPVVLVFHGGLGRPENMPDITGFNHLAETEGFAVAYPRGVSQLENIELDTWNGGLCCGGAQKNNIDDVGFIRALLDDLPVLVSVDPRRIFATGLSNGAIFSYRLACEMADRIAAIGPVSGTQNIAECHPSRPVSVIHFHGTADLMVPFEGGFGKGVSGFSFASVDETIDFWVRVDGCLTAPAREETAALIYDVYTPCAEDAAVELYAIQGGKHAWPGGMRSASGADDPSNAVDATAVMWEFFKAHPKP
jgi:polyhydroxybutyrate depolymerase